MIYIVILHVKIHGLTILSKWRFTYIDIQIRLSDTYFNIQYTIFIVCRLDNLKHDTLSLKGDRVSLLFNQICDGVSFLIVHLMTQRHYYSSRLCQTFWMSSLSSIRSSIFSNFITRSGSVSCT